MRSGSSFSSLDSPDREDVQRSSLDGSSLTSDQSLMVKSGELLLQRDKSMSDYGKRQTIKTMSRAGWLLFCLEKKTGVSFVFFSYKHL